MSEINGFDLIFDVILFNNSRAGCAFLKITHIYYVYS